MKKLPKSVQSLLCASNQINSFSKAVQELVYNSLDAKAKSIAVRINIETGTIQVIDNGCGIQKEDFKHLGKKHMTSKLVDMATLKSVPTKYGYRGQALANLIQISQSLKITSRCEGTESTYVKYFKHGKENLTSNVSNVRPSKGTTVEIQGFLYNFGIQRKSINNVTELQNIKTFLERVSLVHCGISISLRDDTNNEIILKLHKNRDIYQTLSSLYGIKQTDMKELQVEKNYYKVKAYVGQNSDDVTIHYVFVNGKYIGENSKLNKIVNKGFGKTKTGVTRNVKAKRISITDNNDTAAYSMPNYIIFISCPYMDYDIIDRSIEFKNWEQIQKLLEKMVKFYHGDVKLKEVNKKQIEAKLKNDDKQRNDTTREQVKKIIDKILGSHQRKPDVSQLQNGIKGKLMKRKHKKRRSPNISLSKVLPNRNGNSENSSVVQNKKTDLSKTVETHEKSVNVDTIKFNIDGKLINNKNATVQNKSPQLFKTPDIKKPTNKIKKKKHRTSKISLADKFAMQTDSVKQRCQILAQETKKLLDSEKRKIINKISINGAVHYSNVRTNNQNFSVRTKVDEIVIRDYTNFTKPNNVGNIDKHKCVSTYDLVQTILNTQRENVHEFQLKCTHNHGVVDSAINNENYNISFESHHNIPNIACEKVSLCPTYESHTYGVFNETNRIVRNFQFHDKEHNDDISEYYNNNIDAENNSLRPRKTFKSFITERSIDNFSHYNPYHKKLLHSKCKAKSNGSLFKKTYRRRHLFDFENNRVKNKSVHSSYTIEYTESDKHVLNKDVSMENLDIYNPISETISPRIEESYPLLYSSYYNTNYCSIHGDHNEHTEICGKNVNCSLANFSDGNREYNTIHLDDYIQATYTIDNTNPSNNGIPVDNDFAQNSYENQVIVQDKSNIHNTQETYTIESWNEISLENQILNRKSQINNTKNSIDFIFVSTQDKGDSNIVNPIDICETVMDSQSLQKEFCNSFNYIAINRAKMQESIAKSVDNNNLHEEISHHFTNNNDNIDDSILINDQQFSELNNEYNLDVENDIRTFNIANRLCFVPKGMSPIFQNCNTKLGCSYNLHEDYFENKIYDDFAEKVQNKVEIFEPTVQEPRDLTTKDINKANTKLNKDVASLKFDTDCIENCKVLGQVDAKFIAATIKGKSCLEESEFIILFDQHAVHERIRLESNLSDYFNEMQWKSVQLDEVSLRLSKDDVRFLHNFKDKFDPLGFKWSIVNESEILVTHIPEAIIGKNPRPVDKILKSVTNLIKEEINTIKAQSGCISLQPKSILDLVFSEACRYAIKFGDQLSKAECCELIKKLANCKTPFQCAHGRPVMAVLTDIKPVHSSYKIDCSKLRKFRNNIRK